jgi:hypothetical protein
MNRRIATLVTFYLSGLLGCAPHDDAGGHPSAGTVDDGSEQKTLTDPSAQVTLPLEVFGPSGTRVAVSFDLAAPVDDVTHLLVTCHSCGYNDHALDSDPTRIKAAVQVNEGPLVALKHYTKAGRTVVGNPDIVLLKPDDDNYGGVGGGFRTNTMIVPISGLREGQNTLSFEHVSANLASIGFRILGFNLLRGPSPDATVLPSSLFRQDSPSTWTVAATVGSTNATAIQNAVNSGRNLWNKNGHLYDPYLDALDGAVGTGVSPLNGRIRASCAGCHAQDGRDLKYFNYSDRSIIERAVFHRLTRNQGRNIAAYIRSLTMPVVAAARPWNPPYQPGPGMDSRRAYAWAAGAGLEAVLDSDADMRPYLFPKGETYAQVGAVASRFGKLNMRELPIALQLPDWNQWLPMVHPSDAFDASRAPVNQDPTGAAVGRPFYEVLYDEVKASPTPTRLGAFLGQLAGWIGRGATCFTQKSENGATVRGANGVIAQSLRLGPSVPPNISDERCKELLEDRELARPLELAKHGLIAWSTIKLWEIQHSNNLETRGAGQVAPICAGRTCVNASEARGWLNYSPDPTSARVVQMRSDVFTRAPHLLAHNSRYFLSQSAAVGAYETSAWYHLQMVLNPGYRRVMTSHFPYTQGFIERLASESDTSQSFRFWASLIKQRQLQTNGNYGMENGLDLRTAQPFIYYSDDPGNTSVRAGVGAKLWKQLIEIMLRDMLQDARNATEEDWLNAKALSAVQPPSSRDFSPCESCFEPGSRPNPFTTSMTGRNTARLIPRLRLVGVNETVIGQLLDWSEIMWPFGPWDELRNP